MFQTFDDRADSAHSAERVAALRARLASLGLDGFVVPRTDEHQGEYVPASAERLAWLTGFTGSAGTAIVLAGKAAIFVDGRYTLQVRDQVDVSVFEPVSLLETPPAEWLKANVRDGAHIGYDPWLVTRAQARRFAQSLEAAGAQLVPVARNPIDEIWEDRPAPPLAAVSLQPEALTGKSAADKLADIARQLAEKRADAAILTDPASIAWTFNIRGRDVPHTPLPLSFAVLMREGRPTLFIESEKLSNEVRHALEEIVDIRGRAEFGSTLDRLGREGARVLYDPQDSAEAVAAAIEAAGGTILEGPDPVALPKAQKTPHELEGARRAHLRDGAAMVRFLCWLDGEEPGTLTEIDAAMRLEEIRRETAQADGHPLEDLSFETISSTGPNAAINHYRVTRRTNRRLEAGDLYLVDSGAQYRDGTTDITRTVPVGGISGERFDLLRDRYTRVLKGHIAIATARFPKSTSGAQIDAFARQALWSAGLDFDHGTGHGVGSFLSVHEGPQRISKIGHTPLQPGMILSNEPGFYRAGDFGIRIENLVAVREADVPPGGERPMHAFETLTLAPINRRLISTRLMSAGEIAWLNLYHARVRAALSGWPTFDERERAWLEEACRPLAG